ncbi:MAG: biotin--[acetyl-CoA-carboxylase] ligase [Deltaproteobacteria bacterium]|nr:biotin--[acetyl-CoA-carboxylase] ligase [Deltaproteobacteria bacterium]MBW2075427.1 biotin--[acetyl-CoA-carboxylase] ligase [Deltaproteobacteria bacterium]RLB81981.1 MAG: biotin--[acetyl-CoA-carboxylase] ligase [Deltaproteobacteria bacterium]
MNPYLDQRLPNRLSPDTIKEGLRTRWLGQQTIYCFNVVESTNTEAYRLGQEGAPEGTLVVADAQSKGRGRLGRTWVSPPGSGLYLSFVLKPDCPPDWFPRLTLTAGVAVASAIQQMGTRPQLKWPNDILIGDRKVGGILTEAVFDERRIGFAILGIGINVNTKQDELPISVRDLATSLRLGTGKPVSRIYLLQTLLYQFEQWYESFYTGAFDAILETWCEFDTTLGRGVEVFLPETRLTGVAEALGSDGTLLVRDKMGRLHRIVAGDVVHCRLEA